MSLAFPVLSDPAPAATGTWEAAPAKINLALHVTGRRADGYHLLDTLAVFTRSGDRIRVADAPEDAFALHGPFAASLSQSDDNLVLRARDAFRARFGRREPVSITLEKNLPVASGIGGGSSDAAATLRVLARHHGVQLAPDALAALGLPLGADVPMCLAARPLRAGGVGETLHRLSGFPVLPLVLANPGAAVSTPAVFRALQHRENPPLPELPPSPTPRAVAEWLPATRNDLQSPATALAPVIADAVSALEAVGALFARMSGSGATCFGLFATLPAAQVAARRLSQAQPGWWVRADETTASGTAP